MNSKMLGRSMMAPLPKSKAREISFIDSTMCAPTKPRQIFLSNVSSFTQLNAKKGTSKDLAIMFVIMWHNT